MRRKDMLLHAQNLGGGWHWYGHHSHIVGTRPDQTRSVEVHHTDRDGWTVTVDRMFGQTFQDPSLPVALRAAMVAARERASLEASNTRMAIQELDAALGVGNG